MSATTIAKLAVVITPVAASALIFGMPDGLVDKECGNKAPQPSFEGFDINPYCRVPLAVEGATPKREAVSWRLSS
jgi:hypothetical protein